MSDPTSPVTLDHILTFEANLTPRDVETLRDALEQAVEHGTRAAERLLRYLWEEAEVELRPIAGRHVRDAFADNDPLAIDIDALLAAATQDES